MQSPDRDRLHRPPTAVRLAAVAGLALLAACVGPEAVRPTAEHVPSFERAERLARAGDHAGAARQYEAAAGALTGEPQANALSQAAREWLRVPNLGDAQRVVGALDAIANVDPRSPAGTTRGLVGAEVALAAGLPDRALASLRALGDPPPPGTEADVLWLRGRALLSAGRALEGVKALLARERLLPPAQATDARQALWDALRNAAARGASLAVPRGTEPVAAGWLELARVATQGRRNPYAQRTQLAEWRSRYPAHPAQGPIVEAMQTEVTPQLRLPAQVALLLPLSGRLSDAGEALRDGFLAAYYQQDPAGRPLVRLYDTATDPATAYRRAVADGAGFVVGPLGKENVQAVKSVADGAVPTLALNALPDGETTPPRFYQFALAPEDEARQVAERLLAEHRRVGVALVPAGEWGSRVLAAFQAALVAGGGTLAASRSFASGTTDFSEPLTQILGFEESQRRQRALVALLGPLQFTPRRRDDLQFVFFAGQPVQGRSVRPQLKFHYAGDLPVYSTSDVYEPNPAANQDLDGVAFVDVPWMIADDPAIAELRGSVGQLWPATARRRGRLFAMGFDAWRLIGELAAARTAGAEPVAGMTGRLTVDTAGRVRRGLDWAVIGTDGQARPLPPPSPEL
ncbi:MAG: penicillin-binding protein activator [Proteobacteria bacterium]|nr:penicillin-binding protein activator [Pseudomonadota bacterium]